MRLITRPNAEPANGIGAAAVAALPTPASATAQAEGGLNGGLRWPGRSPPWSVIGACATTDAPGRAKVCGTDGVATGGELQRQVWKNPCVQPPVAQESLQLSTS